MTLIKTAQQNLFTELARTNIKPGQEPEFNGYGIDDFGHFQTHLNTLYDAFEVELGDNLTSRHPSLPLYLTDCKAKLAEIREHVRNYQAENLIQLQVENPEQFRLNKLGYMSHFLSFQSDMIDKITAELNQKLELANDKEFFSSVMPSGTGETNFKNKLRVNLSKNDLAVLIWWLAESKILEFDGSRTLLVKFIEANLMYLDKSRDMHFDAKYIQTVMSKLTDPTSPEVDLQQSRQNLLDKLISTELPPTTYVIKTMKPKD